MSNVHALVENNPVHTLVKTIHVHALVEQFLYQALLENIRVYALVKKHPSPCTGRKDPCSFTGCKILVQVQSLAAYLLFTTYTEAVNLFYFIFRRVPLLTSITTTHTPQAFVEEHICNNTHPSSFCRRTYLQQHTPLKLL